MHDRFIVIDDKEMYHLEASIKDLSKKCFGINKIEDVKVIEKIINLYSDISIFDHFADVSKMVQIGSEAQREHQDYKLTRYACYLIAQNGDSRKKQLL